MEEYELGLIERGNTVTTRGTRSHVDFNFSCLFTTYEYYDNVLLARTSRPSIRHSCISIGLDESTSYGDSLEMIDQGLRDWPILNAHEPERRELIEIALEAAERILGSMPLHHNVLVIPLSIDIARHRVVDQSRAMELMPRRSMGEADRSGMVPAADSSIDEFLQIKTATGENEDDESCSICLDDFYAGCELASMPCSHVFHESCIKKWLKSSHYCPLCRFEMPTSTN